MNLSIKNKVIVGILLVLTLLSFACEKKAEAVKAQTPTEAYKSLYAAVKSKNADAVKQTVSDNTHGLAEFMAAQQKQPVEKIYENGFTATTFSPTLPEMRDERIKDKFGALEVFNAKDNRWEDLPFIFEDGGWKLAVGDVFKNTYTSPGEGQAEFERRSSGSDNMMMQMNSNTPANTSANKMNAMPPVNKAKK